MSDLVRRLEDDLRQGKIAKASLNQLASDYHRLRLALEQIRRETQCDRAWRVAMNALHPELKDAA